jgi:hypothetical protein
MVDPVQLKILQHPDRDDIVAALKELVRRAESDQFLAFAFAAVTDDNGVYFHNRVQGRRIALLGAVTALQVDLANTLIEVPIPPAPPEQGSDQPA